MIARINTQDSFVSAESNHSQSSKLNSKTIGNQGYTANIGFNEAESSTDQTTFTNSQITAENGNLNITTNKDATSTNLCASSPTSKLVVSNPKPSIIKTSQKKILPPTQSQN